MHTLPSPSCCFALPSGTRHHRWLSFLWCYWCLELPQIWRSGKTHLLLLLFWWKNGIPFCQAPGWAAVCWVLVSGKCLSSQKLAVKWKWPAACTLDRIGGSIWKLAKQKKPAEYTAWWCHGRRMNPESWRLGPWSSALKSHHPEKVTCSWTHLVLPVKWGEGGGGLMVPKIDALTLLWRCTQPERRFSLLLNQNVERRMVYSVSYKISFFPLRFYSYILGF